MKNKKGVALILVMCLVLVVSLGAASFMGLAGNEIKLASLQADSTKAFYLAEAGVQRAVYELKSGGGSWTNWTDVGGKKVLSTSLGSGQFKVVVTDATGDTPTVTSTGYLPDITSPEVQREVRVVLRHNLPAPENAINIFGSPTKHAKVKIMEHDKKHQGEILVSGFDAGSGSDRLALGVEDIDALNKIINDLGKHLKKGGDLEDILVGDPMNTFTDKKGNTFTASIGQVDSQGFDADLMENIAEQLADDVRSMTPTQTIDLGGKKRGDDLLDPDGDGEVELGGSEDDVIYLTNGELKLKEELSIEGTGTLIIDGGKLDLDNATFDWDGDIYILGNDRKGEAKFKVRHAEVDIDGDIFLLGSDDGKAKLEFHNEDGKNDGDTEIVGSILAFGGTGDKSKVELKVHHGDLDIEGFITMTGTKSKLDIHQHHHKDADSDIKIEGGICILVPEADKKKKEKAEIKLRAHGGGEGSLEIQYNSDIVDAAIQRLTGKLDLPDRLLNVTSWQEL